jgi:hypothetical protein
MNQVKLANGNRLKIKEFVSEWNIRYPYDYWWRKKYGIPFGAKEHLEANHINMVIEFMEDRFHEKVRDMEDNEEKELYNSVLNNTEDVNTKQIVKMNNKELDSEFNNIDLNDF